MGKKEAVRNRGEKRHKKKGKQKKNTWTLFFGRTSQTNEAIKMCETSAVQSARRCSTAHKHNCGQSAEGMEC